MRLTKRELQAKLKTLTAANNRARVARDAIYAHCETVYGTTPSEVDNDAFIDACDAGCGLGGGMTADEFDRTMRDAMEIAGIQPPSNGD